MTHPHDPVQREKLTFDNADALLALCGQNNNRIKLIERTAGVDLHLRGNEIIIEADATGVALAKSALSQLYGFALRGKPLSTEDVVRAVKVLRADGTAKLTSIFSDTVLVPRAGRPITPKGIAQKNYVEAVRRDDIVFGIGPAGTGKTYLAMAMAIKSLLDKSCQRIILTRPAVEAGEKLGFLPGTLEEKVNPYLRPLYDALNEMLEPSRARRLIEDEVIEIAPLAFMRGRTLNDSFVILDEAQNTSAEQMKMLLTRLGFGSKAVITGDLSQVDLPRHMGSGLRDAVGLLEGIAGIAICRFTDVDVVRHPLVQDIIRAYETRDAERERARDTSHEVTTFRGAAESSDGSDEDGVSPSVAPTGPSGLDSPR